MTHSFFGKEVEFWKKGYDSGLSMCQTKIYLIEISQTYARLMNFLTKTKVTKLTDLNERVKELPTFSGNIEDKIERLEEIVRQQNGQKSQNQCSCGGIGLKFDKNDIKS